MKLHNSFITITVMFFSSFSIAHSADLSNADEEFFEKSMKPVAPPLAKIEKVLRTYADTVGCEFSMNRKNIVEIDIDKDGEKEFVALFNNDHGCLGGSGTGRSSLAVLKYRDEFHKEDIYVRPEMTEPGIFSFGFPRFIDHIFVKKGQLFYATKVHGKDDPNNFPSIPVEAQIQLLKAEAPLAKNNKITNFYWKSSKNYDPAYENVDGINKLKLPDQFK